MRCWDSRSRLRSTPITLRITLWPFTTFGAAMIGAYVGSLATPSWFAVDEVTGPLIGPITELFGSDFYPEYEQPTDRVLIHPKQFSRILNYSGYDQVTDVIEGTDEQNQTFAAIHGIRFYITVDAPEDRVLTHPYLLRALEEAVYAAQEGQIAQGDQPKHQN